VLSAGNAVFGGPNRNRNLQKISINAALAVIEGSTEPQGSGSVCKQEISANGTLLFAC